MPSVLISLITIFLLFSTLKNIKPDNKKVTNYLLIFIILSYVYYSPKIKKHNGLIVGLLFVLLFTARFVIEFFKENQQSFEDTMALNMGQILSIPFVIAGLVLIFWKKKIPNN